MSKNMNCCGSNQVERDRRCCYYLVLTIFASGAIVGFVFLFLHLAYSGGEQIYAEVTDFHLDHYPVFENQGELFANFNPGSTDLTTDITYLTSKLVKIYTRHDFSPYTVNNQTVYKSYNTPAIIPLWANILVLISLLLALLFVCTCATCASECCYISQD